MWPFSRKQSIPTDTIAASNPLEIIDGTRNTLVKMRDFHRDGMLRWEKRINEAHLKHDQHQAAYMAIEAVLSKIDNRVDIGMLADDLTNEIEALAAPQMPAPPEPEPNELRKMLDDNSVPVTSKPLPYFSTPEQRDAEGWCIGDVVQMQGVDFVIQDQQQQPTLISGKRKVS